MSQVTAFIDEVVALRSQVFRIGSHGPELLAWLVEAPDPDEVTGELLRRSKMCMVGRDVHPRCRASP